MPFNQATYPKTEIFSLEGLVEWLRGQNLDTEYDWADGKDCLWARYGRAMGLDDPDSAYDDPDSAYYAHVEVLNRFRQANPNNPMVPECGEPFNGLACRRPWTYRAALARAEALLEAGHE